MIRRIVALALAFAAPVLLIPEPAEARSRPAADTTASPGSGTGHAVQAMVAAPLAVPEPAAWAMLIGGFGFAGLSLRRHRARLARKRRPDPARSDGGAGGRR